MQVDPGYLQRHYASLSDEALLDINPDDLVDTARACFEAEFRERQLNRQVELYADEGPLVEIAEGDDEPGWLEDGVEIYSGVIRAGAAAAPDADHFRTTLEAAGIPCHLEIHEEEPAEPVASEATHRWRLVVPGKLNLQATGILQRDVFNEEMEAGWRAHLEALTDEEISAVNPHTEFCGLFDQIDRVTRAFKEELSRRGLR